MRSYYLCAKYFTRVSTEDESSKFKCLIVSLRIASNGEFYHLFDDSWLVLLATLIDLFVTRLDEPIVGRLVKIVMLIPKND